METDELVDGFRALRLRLNEGESEAAHYHNIIAPVLKQLDALYWSGHPYWAPGNGGQLFSV